MPLNRKPTIAEVSGFHDHVSSGQVLTLAGMLGSVYDEIKAKQLIPSALL